MKRRGFFGALLAAVAAPFVRRQPKAGDCGTCGMCRHWSGIAYSGGPYGHYGACRAAIRAAHPHDHRPFLTKLHRDNPCDCGQFEPRLSVKRPDKWNVATLHFKDGHTIYFRGGA